MRGADGIADLFAPDYATARARFRERAGARGFDLEAHAIGPTGPRGEELTIDVARACPARPTGMVVVSSGLHGVEGFFGAAVQLAILESDGVATATQKGVALVLIHALNPYGFAWVRRCNEENVDLNRNFLGPHEPYRGSPPRYAAFNPLLNPKYPPRRVDAFRFRLQVVQAILRHGMPELKQAVAGGQYDFPRGLFFGGAGPSRTSQILAEHLPRWVGDAERVLHLDFHTGLGRWATYQLLVDSKLSPARFDWLRRAFGPAVQHSDPGQSIAYQTRGDIGSWCHATFPDRTYELLCAEFGTYPPIAVVAALRAENQAHHWGRPDDPATGRARRRLLEAFVPASTRWRSRAVTQALEIIRQGLEACSRSARHA
jgi:hypothetical protein